MDTNPSTLADWSPAQIDAGRRWVKTWRHAGIELERIRRAELRALDTQKAIASLCGSPIRPRPLSPTSGLVEQQRWFMRAANRDLDVEPDFIVEEPSDQLTE